MRRVAIGNYSGNFLFRVSKAGYDAVTGALQNMILHEQLEPIVPVEEGSVTIAGQSSTSVTLQNSYSYNPFIILRCDQNFGPSIYTFMAMFNRDTSSLTIYNLTGNIPQQDLPPVVSARTLTIKYFVFDRISG